MMARFFSLVKGGLAVFWHRNAQLVLEGAKLRETWLNRAMILEAKQLNNRNESDFDLPIILCKIKLGSADLIFGIGYPISRMLLVPWQIPEDECQFVPYLADCSKTAEFRIVWIS